MKLSHKEFERIVEGALARIPQAIRDHMQNLAISIEKRPDAELLEEMDVPPGETLFGIYTGIPLPERSAMEPPLYPDTILIFKEPLERYCETIEELQEEIEITVVHEVAHYVGLSDEGLADLGYG
ncbi:MAG: metallopeptidase family protein [Desulfobacterales bacterium]|nr:metallopeptidase family protein [Desulfobacterales bacterium]